MIVAHDVQRYMVVLVLPRSLRTSICGIIVLRYCCCCYCCRTPLKLEATIDAVLQAFDAQKTKVGMMGDAASLMSPEVIQRMRRLLSTLQKEFL